MAMCTFSHKLVKLPRLERMELSAWSLCARWIAAAVGCVALLLTAAMNAYIDLDYLSSQLYYYSCPHVLFSSFTCFLRSCNLFGLFFVFCFFVSSTFGTAFCPCFFAMFVI